MADNEQKPAPATVDEIQQGWQEVRTRVAQLEAQRALLEKENKDLRFLLERVIDHRQKSHSELVLLISGLVSKLPINDVGVVVSKLVEHNANVAHTLAGFVKGAVEGHIPQPEILRTMEQTKKDLTTALKPVLEELLKLDTPLEREMLESLTQDPEAFFSPRFVRGNRCLVKGTVPRERVIREFGDDALGLFDDLTTDPKRNPFPKPDEIVMGFKSDFESLLQQRPEVAAAKRDELMKLYHRVQRSKAPTDEARTQRNAFQRLSFIVELLHYYEHQSTEPADVMFAQRLPGLIEQLVLAGTQDALDEKLIVTAESLLALVSSPDHRQMVINNIGKVGGAGKTLKYVLALRSAKGSPGLIDHTVAELIKHLIPTPKAPPSPTISSVLRLTSPEMQTRVLKAMLTFEKLRKDEASALVQKVGTELGLKEIPKHAEVPAGDAALMEQQRAWARIKEMISSRTDTAQIATAIRDRLNARYDSDEVRQSWLVLVEADPITIIKVICQLPYLPDGRTDPIARTVLESYVTRLTHEKYLTTYNKVVNSLKTMFSARPDNPTLLNFLALVKWVSPDSVGRLQAGIGMPVAA